MRRYILRRLALEGIDPDSDLGRRRAFDLLRGLFPRARAINLPPTIPDDA